MKFTPLAIALSIIPELTLGCVTAHVYLNNCIFGGDTLSAQVFDSKHPPQQPPSSPKTNHLSLPPRPGDDIEVCNGGSTINLASGDSNFCIDGCQPGYSFCVSHNAKTAVYDNGHGYRASMNAAKTQNTDYVCGAAGSHDVKGSEVESCFFDGFWNCNLFKPCDLCDYRATCPR